MTKEEIAEAEVKKVMKSAARAWLGEDAASWDGAAHASYGQTTRDAAAKPSTENPASAIGCDDRSYMLLSAASGLIRVPSLSAAVDQFKADISLIGEGGDYLVVEIENGVGVGGQLKNGDRVRVAAVIRYEPARMRVDREQP